MGRRSAVNSNSGRKVQKQVHCQARDNITRRRAWHKAHVARGNRSKVRTNTYWDAREAELINRRLPRERDELRENALLILDSGLLYREFHEACQGRVQWPGIQVFGTVRSNVPRLQEQKLTPESF